MFGVLLLSYYIFLDFLSTRSMLWHTSCCHFTLICSFIIKHWLSWSNVFCCHGSFAWALFHFLLTLSPVIFHPAFTFTGPTSVCILSAGWGWLRELPLHAFITWAIFMWAARLCSAGDERGLERCSRCVGSLWSCSVFFIFTWTRSRSFFIFHAFSLPLSLYGRQCVIQAAFLFHISSSVSGLAFIGSFPSTACCCRSSSHSSGCNHVRVPPLLLSWFAPQPFNLFFFYFRTPTSALHHFRPSFPGCSPPMIGSVGIFFSVCFPPFLPPLCLHEL